MKKSSYNILNNRGSKKMTDYIRIGARKVKLWDAFLIASLIIFYGLVLIVWIV